MTEEERLIRRRQLEDEIARNLEEIKRKQKENAIELYNVGRVHKKQVLFHESDKRIKAFFGGNRVGKTVAGAVEAVCHALGYGRFRELKPSSGWVVSLTNEVQRDVAQKEILKWLPKREIKDFVVRHGRKDDPVNSIIDKIILKNGETIGFKTCEQGRESFQGTSQGFCIAEGQRVWMSDGTYRNIEDVKVGDMVVTLNGHGDYVNKRVVAKHDQGIRDVIEVNTSRNLDLICTPDHKVYDSLNNKVEIGKAERIYQARFGWEIPSTVDKDDAYYAWTGLVLSEGCVSQKKITMDAADVVEKAGAMLPEGAYVRKKEFKGSHVPDWFLNWPDFWAITEVALADAQSVPDWVFTSSDEKIALFLSYLYSGDGWASKHIIGYASTSRRLSEDVCLLLWRLGIRANVTKRKSGGENWKDQWWVMVTSSDYVKRFAEVIGIIGKEKALADTVAIAERRIESKRNRGFAKGRECIDIATKTKNNNVKNRYATVKNTENLGKTRVYDLSIEDYHRFFVGTSLVSNCWFDEEPPLEIFQECQMRVMDTEGDMWFTMTPLKGLTFVYNLIYLNERNDPDIEYWMAEWEDNPWLSVKEIEKLISTMTDEEREARQYGRFTSLCGFAFPELRKDIHIVKPMSMPDSNNYVALDYGFDSLAVVWVRVDRYGNARVYKALRKKNLIISDACKAILKYNGGDRITAYYAPPDLWNRRQDTGKSAFNIFYENGITLVKAKNDREMGWLNLHEWLRPYVKRDEQTGAEYRTARFLIEEGVDPDLWRCLTNIQKADKNPNDVSNTPHDLTHYPDALRYFVSARFSMPKGPAEPQYPDPFNLKRFRRDEEMDFGEVTEEYVNYGCY